MRERKSKSDEVPTRRSTLAEIVAPNFRDTRDTPIGAHKVSFYIIVQSSIPRTRRFSFLSDSLDIARQRVRLQVAGYCARNGKRAVRFGEARCIIGDIEKNSNNANDPLYIRVTIVNGISVFVNYVS